MLKTFPARATAASYSSFSRPSASSSVVRRRCATTASAGSRGRPCCRRVRPAAGDRLRPRVEVDAFRAVDVPVAEERVLPAAERVVRHRHGDRDVDPDHADVHVELELPRDAAVACEERDAVPVRVLVHEPRAPRHSSDAHDGEDGAEDLVAVRVHLRRHVVEERDAEEEAVRCRAPSRGRRRRASRPAQARTRGTRRPCRGARASRAAPSRTTDRARRRP